MKIIAVGMNYARHNKELGHTQINTEPVIFMKPDSAILKDSKPFFIPDFSNEIHYETELVVRINRLGKNIAPRFANRYYDAVTVGIDFTARDLQRKFREQGNPWELCKGFDSYVQIETEGISLGQSVVDSMNFYRKASNARVLTEVDVYGFFQMFLSRILDQEPEKLDILQDLIRGDLK